MIGVIGHRDRQDGNRGDRRCRLAWRGVLLVATLSISSTSAAGRPAAASAFLGEIVVEAAEGTARAAGTGNSFGACSTGEPTTAAAGKRNGKVTVNVRPATCTDQGTVAAHRLPAGTYEVRYTSAATYTQEGDRWMRAPGPQGHCFAAANAEATRVLGSFSVDADGVGTWTGRLTPSTGGAAISGSDEPGRASNLCIGSQDPSLRPDHPTTGGPPGLQVPFRLLPGDARSAGPTRKQLMLVAAGGAGVAGMLALAGRRRRA